MDRLRIFLKKNVMITGGLGFIGSNLAHALVRLKARVLIVDSLSPLCGGNIFNIKGIKNKCGVVIGDVKDRSLMDRLVKRQDFIFNLAGQVSHVDSSCNPVHDLRANCLTHLALLEACKRHNNYVKIVYAGTRSQYGRPLYLPVNEKHPMIPVDINGINKMAAESYHLLYYRNYGIRSTSLRLTNTYGPRHQMRNGRQGFLSRFIRLAVDNKKIKIFGDGRQVRDLNYVDDAVRAFLIAAADEYADGQVFNLGCGRPMSVMDAAELIVELSGSGKITRIPFPAKYSRVEIGDYCADFTKIKKMLKWKPEVSLKDGLRMTIDYYKTNKRYYWE